MLIKTGESTNVSGTLVESFLSLFGLLVARRKDEKETEGNTKDVN